MELRAGPARVVVDAEAGGRLASVSVAGLELLAPPTGDPLGSGCYPMAPWAGRVRRGRFAVDGVAHRLELDLPPHAIHGTVYRARWSVVSCGEAACELVCPLGAGWPFRGVARQEVALDAGGLALRLAVEAEEPMPAVLGCHPWWARDLTLGGPLEVEFDAPSRWELDGEGIPSGRLVPAGERPLLGWDDCFHDVAVPPVLRWPGALEVTLRSSCPEWVLFDGPSHAVCLEPQTGPPDAVNLGKASLVVPGRPLAATFEWRWLLS